MLFFTLAKEARTEEIARIHMEKQFTQLKRKPAHVEKKQPTQVRNEPAQATRGDIPEVQTLDSQVRIDTLYH